MFRRGAKHFPSALDEVAWIKYVCFVPHPKKQKPTTFADYKPDGRNWITLATGEYFPDILKDACKLYEPVLLLFGQLLRSSESSTRLLMLIAEQTDGWMRVQLARVFRKYVSPETPQGSGPWRAVMESDPGLPTHTVYRPLKLDALGQQKLPIVAFANGGCANLGSRFRYFLSEIASHGFIAIATGPIGSPEAEQSTGGRSATQPAAGSPAARFAAAGITGDAAKRSGLGPGQTLPAQLTQAIDWAIAENSRPGSPYRGRIETSQIAVMGQSCGGLQAIAAAQDPRVKTLGVWNSGILPDAPLNAHISGADVGPEHVARLRIPALYVTGEPSDVAFDNADADFARGTHGPLLRAWREQTGHSGTYREPDGGAFGKVAVAWLRWRLKGDLQAARQFTGPDCGLCSLPDWHVKKKLID